MSFFLRDATQAELERLPALLPKWNYREGDELIVAEAASPARVVGGVAFGVRKRAPEVSFGQLDFQVLPRFRETDLLEQLVQSALRRDEASGVSDVEVVAPLRQGTPEFAALQRMGFAEHRQLVCYEFDVPSILARTRAIHERMVRRGAIPAGVEAVPFAQRHWPEVARLVLAENLMDPPALQQIAQDGPASYFNRASRVLLADGVVKGVILGRSQGRISEVPALAVAPELRGGNSWANALLNFHYTAVTAALGQEIITMWADPARHPMTTHLARRMASPIIVTEIFLRKGEATI